MLAQVTFTEPDSLVSAFRHHQRLSCWLILNLKT